MVRSISGLLAAGLALAGSVVLLAIEDPHDLLTLTDVWGSDHGGTAATLVDLTRCGGAIFSATNVACRLSFPWLSAADSPRQLAALGADQVRVARLVGPAGREVTETVVSFPIAAWPGPAELGRQALDCGGTPVRSATGTTAWSTQGRTTLAVRTDPSRAVAVEYADAGLSRHQQEQLVDRAVVKAATLTG